MYRSKKNRRVSIRWISIAIFFILIFPLAVFLGKASVDHLQTLQENSRRNKLRSYESAVQNLEVELRKADSFLNYLLTEFTPLQELRFQTEETATFLKKQELNKALGSFLAQNTLAAGITVYCADTHQYLERDSGTVFYDIDKRLLFREDLHRKALALAEDTETKQSWFTLRAGGGNFLCKSASLDNIWIFCCFQIDQLAQYLEQSAVDVQHIIVSENDMILADLSFESAALDTGIINLQTAFGLTWIGVLDDSYGFDAGTRYAILQTVIAVLGLIALPVVYLIWRRSFLTPLEELKHTMDSIKSGNMEMRVISEHAGREMEAINSTFNEMMTSIRTLKIAGYEKEIKAKQAQLDFYKVQIRPHFYLNCLKNLYSLTKEKKIDEIGQSILLLADYLRYTFQQDQSQVPISKELEQCREYVKLFGISASYPPEIVVRADDAVLQISIPPLSILTLVENALKHTPSGQRVVHIEIRVNRMPMEDEVYTHISVKDDGDGFLRDVEDDLNSRDWDGDAGTHAGLKNIIQRLYLTYGKERVFLGFYSDPGAVVELFFPMKEPNRKEEDL